MTGNGSVVTTSISAGEIAGTADDEVMRFLAVPYAAAPFGDRRFTLPEPPAAWSGVRDATAYGPTSPQREPLFFADVFPPANRDAGDILHVNVWAPRERAAAGHPVLVWFHGGALVEWSNAMRMLDGSRFAQRGVVVVSANYRLGAEGFSVLDGAPLNLGLADQAAVLHWVQDEIEVFGGDAGRVTIAGQSSGGATTAALLCSPHAQGMVQRAIVQSGPLDASDVEVAGEITRRMAKHLDVPATRDAFAAIPPADLLAAQVDVLATSFPGGDELGFHLAIDGDLVLESPHESLRRGRADDVPLLIGVTSEERMLWMDPTGLVHLIDDTMLQFIAGAQGLPDDVVEAYRNNRPGAPAGEVLGALISDHRLRAPMVDIADARAARGAATHVYEFDWHSPLHGLGAGHSIDLPFVFDTLDEAESQVLVGDAAPRPLAKDMNAAWTRFIAGDDVGWPAWDATRPYKVFDGERNDVARDPRPLERAAMATMMPSA